MSLAQPAQAPAVPAAPARTLLRRGRSGWAGRRPGTRADLLFAALALALAGWVTGGLWLDPNRRVIQVNSGDQALFEWLLAYGAHALTHLRDPLFTHLLNVPDGVNLAVNTSITVYAVGFAPLTLLLGPAVTFVVILTLNLAATGYAWYWLLSRQLGASRLAAAVGGVFCGFAPGMVSHANAHLNWTAQWLVPLVVWRVLALVRQRRPVRDGVVLGLLVAVMFSIAAEALFFTALACAVFLGSWGLARRARAAAAVGGLARGLAVTGLVAGVLLAYPLWLHFFGAQRYHGTGFSQAVHAEDLLGYGAYPQRSLAGGAGLGTDLAANPTEENSFFGLPLLLLVAGCFGLLWRTADADRRATVRALGITAGVFAVLSLGPRLKVAGVITDLPLPFALLGNLPVMDAALPARLALVLTPIIGVLLAATVDRLPRAGWPRAGWAVAFTVALLPLVPVPLATVAPVPVPRFITEGTWRGYVSSGGVLVPVPPASDLLPDGQRWQAYALARRQGEFAIPAGFFLGPGGPDGHGRIGPVPRPSALLLAEVARTGQVPAITAQDRSSALADLRYWRAEAVVLPDAVHGSKWPVQVDALRRAAADLYNPMLGPGVRIGDVTVWRVPPTR